MSIFSNNLLYLRKKAGLGQPELASRLGYKSYTTIQKWEDGSNEPYASTLKAIADLFNVTMEDLYNNDLSSVALMQDPDDVKVLLIQYRQLNDEGQEKVRDYTRDLINTGRYIKSHKSKMVE